MAGIDGRTAGYVTFNLWCTNLNYDFWHKFGHLLWLPGLYWHSDELSAFPLFSVKL